MFGRIHKNPDVNPSPLPLPHSGPKRQINHAETPALTDNAPVSAGPAVTVAARPPAGRAAHVRPHAVTAADRRTPDRRRPEQRGAVHARAVSILSPDAPPRVAGHHGRGRDPAVLRRALRGQAVAVGAGLRAPAAVVGRRRARRGRAQRETPRVVVVLACVEGVPDSYAR
jgi:hypothetical protein